MARVIVASLVVLTPFVAHADERYRLEIAATDLAGVGLFVPGTVLRDAHGGDTAASATMRIAGTGLYLVGGPAVHLAHREYARAGASFGLRLAMAKLGVFLGRQLSDCRPDKPTCDLEGFVIGPTIAAFVDVFVLAPPPGGPVSPDSVQAGALGSSNVVVVGAVGHF